MHADHAAWMIFPDVSGEAHYLTTSLKLAHRIEWFGHRESVDLLRSECRRHLRRRHHHQINFVRCEGFPLVFDHWD